MIADPVIVGRGAELEQVEAALTALGEGRGACLAVSGEPGIGKTRLLAELRERADGQGRLVLAGAAAEFERDVPFGVWADALDAYVVAADLPRRAGWGDALTDELAEVLPSLHDGRSGGAGPADERYRTHRAVRALLAAITADRPLVLVLDDLHWSDGASVELIASVIRRGAGLPLLLALAFRPGRPADRLGPALAAPQVRRLRLGPLGEADAARLLGGDGAAVAAVYRQGGGNPFYLEQLWRSGGYAAPSAGNGAAPGGGVPPAVAASLAEELASLAPPSRAFLEAAAVAGEPFEPDLAAAIGQLDADAGLAALDDLLGLDLVRPTKVPRRFIFRHPLVRRAVYESAPGGTRMAAHARAAAALAARGAGPAERAHHVEQSAGRGDEDAIALLLAAGGATERRAPDAAARWYAAALRLLPEGDVERRVAVRVALASAQRSLGELDACRATLLEAIDLLPRDDVARRVELTARCAAVEHWIGRHEDAHRRLASAWAELPDRAGYEAAALEIELAVDAIYTFDYGQARATGASALATTLRLGDAGLIAASASALALAEVVDGETAPAREHHALAVERIDRLADAELAPRLETLYYLTWAESYLEHYDAAIAHADRGLAIARASGEGRMLVPMLLARCYPLEMQGRLAEAIETCERALEAARLSAHPHFLFWALWEQAFALYYAGDLDAAIDACEESARVGGRMIGGTMPSAGGGPGWALASCRLESGQPEAALALMRELGGEDLERFAPVERCFDWEILALAELALGRHERADALARRAEADAERLGLQLAAALARRTRACVQLATGDAAGAAASAQASLDAAGRVGAALQIAYSRALLGRALAAAGDRTRAIAVLRKAEQELDASGSVRPRDEARRELRRLGARAESRGPRAAGESGLDALSRRESEIAGMLCDRFTNREIAAALFLSEKTVETHVRHVFHKLGVSSRVAVARQVEQARRGADGG